jgi:hypothetical protein
MAECFCGCGRKIGFGSRGMNKQGRRTVGLLAKLREARTRVDRDESLIDPALLVGIASQFSEVDPNDPESMTQGIRKLLDQLIEGGQEFEGFWTAAVHDDLLPPPQEARAIRKDWEAWGKLGMASCDAIGVPIERGVGAAMKGRV